MPGLTQLGSFCPSNTRRRKGVLGWGPHWKWYSGPLPKVILQLRSNRFVTYLPSGELNLITYFKFLFITRMAKQSTQSKRQVIIYETETKLKTNPALIALFNKAIVDYLVFSGNEYFFSWKCRLPAKYGIFPIQEALITSHMIFNRIRQPGNYICHLQSTLYFSFVLFSLDQSSTIEWIFLSNWYCIVPVKCDR